MSFEGICKITGTYIWLLNVIVFKIANNLTFYIYISANVRCREFLSIMLDESSVLPFVPLLDFN